MWERQSDTRVSVGSGWHRLKVTGRVALWHWRQGIQRRSYSGDGGIFLVLGHPQLWHFPLTCITCFEW